MHIFIGAGVQIYRSTLRRRELVYVMNFRWAEDASSLVDDIQMRGSMLFFVKPRYLDGYSATYLQKLPMSTAFAVGRQRHNLLAGWSQNRNAAV